MMYQIEYAYTCHMGRVRANNEDNLWCCGESLPADNQGMEGVHSQIVSGLKTPAMAVFDGMGGESCGEMAAFRLLTNSEDIIVPTGGLCAIYQSYLLMAYVRV